METTGAATVQKAELTLSLHRRRRAEAIASAGGIEAALATGSLPRHIDTTVSEALVLGLLRQGVHTFVGVFGHGSTEVGEVLRIYEEAGLLRMYGVRSEIEASHAASALRWVTGERAAVISSIGPGALQALAASLVPASNGIGLWYLMGDETTEDEGPNMQQIPKPEQELYLRLCGTMGQAYTLHTPLALGAALRRGLNTVDHPHRGGPFYLLLPMNIQPATMADFNLDELPVGAPPRLGKAADDGAYDRSVEAILAAERPVVRIGGGAREAGAELLEFLDLSGGVAVVSPVVSGVVPYEHPRNMLLGGSKGSLSGNYAMEQADVLVAVGTRSVCQSDCSRTAYPNVRQVISVNTDVEAAMHYGRTLALVGDAKPTLAELNRRLRAAGASCGRERSDWLRQCRKRRQAWERHKQERYDHPVLYDPKWGGAVLTQPAAVKAATDWARANGAVTFFDAGDVQANGMQIAEDDRVGRTISDTGATYMGFAVSALLASALSTEGFYGIAITGDGSFTMSPQILIDGAVHGVRGCILLLDNRRMGAISALQTAQHGADYATGDCLAIDYIAWAKSIPGVAAFEANRSPDELLAALDQARAHSTLSLIHVPVYYGPDPLGGLGSFGRWNVGNWVEETQALRHSIGL